MSSTAFLEKKEGVNFLTVASSATALAPFSQYSAMPDRSSSGSGQAQLGQSYPPFLLRCHKAVKPRTAPASPNTCLPADKTARMPTAAFLILPRFNPVNCSGFSAPGIFFSSLLILQRVVRLNKY